MLIAQKPCSFAGQRFRIGDEIPDGLVIPEAKTRLIRNGTLAEAGAGVLLPAQSSIENAPAKDADLQVAVPIIVDDGNEWIQNMSVEDVIKAIRIIQMEDEDILAKIETIESEETLILIDVLKGATEPIHTAASERASAIAPADEQDPVLVYTEDGLMKHTRDQLVEIATEMGIEVTDENVKREITAAILKKQAGSDE